MTRPNLQGAERLLTIDPGTPHEGAYWSRGALVDVSVIGTQVWVHRNLVVVCEVPHIHKDTKDPQDIVDLAMRIGEDLRGPTRASGATWIQYLPYEWKGQLKKWSHHAHAVAHLWPQEWSVLERALGHSRQDTMTYIQAACDAHATRRKVTYARKGHNILDAVALGLWCLGRI